MTTLLNRVAMPDDLLRQEAEAYAIELVHNDREHAMLTLAKYQANDVDWLVRNSVRRGKGANFMSYVAQKVKHCLGL